jgi:hypothetical protein
MKLIGIIITVFITFFGIGQVSYDFSTSLPPVENEINTVDRIHFGTYTAEEANSAYEFNELGVWIISTVFNSVSKEQVRESSKYTVRNGFIFGVSEDSIPCVLENDRYHFGIKNKDQIIGSNSKNVLKKANNNQYLLNFEENGKFVPTLITFKGNNVDVQQFDYESGTTIFDDFKLFNSTKKQEMNFITITPTSKEWKKFNFKKLIFGKPITYLNNK